MSAPVTEVQAAATRRRAWYAPLITHRYLYLMLVPGALVAGDHALAWKCTELPRPAGCDMRFAETSVLAWPDSGDCTAIVRYSAGSLPGLAEQVALVSNSADGGRTWTPLAASNLPMTASKPYAGHLSNGQAFLVASPDLRLPGRAKSPQWSYPYPYAHEHAGHLYVVYSIGKEDCGLSIIPLHAIRLP